ncbi:MAG: C/D box methylation guide ribonucleoprotein complex aNOP56 subunit [Thermoprotei archaeon]|nr:MAG: C/D box methylation guide ribonucleoprotein complex aNOP56 subunit [Thermoprotei archaeon]
MIAYLVDNILGVFALNSNGDIIDKVLFEGSVDEISQKIYMLEKSEVISELRDLIGKLIEGGVSELVLEDEKLARRIKREFGVNVKIELPSKLAQKFRRELPEYLSKVGIDYENYLDKLFEISQTLTKMKVREAAERRDLFIAQSISAIDEIDRTINLFASRLREWYGLHFPELGELIREHELYAKVVANIGLRDNMRAEQLIALGLDEKKARRIVDVAKKSMGAKMTSFDIEYIQAFASQLLRLYELRRKLEVYVDEAMKEVAPNIRGLVGPLLGARLIALAGGLNKLATLPASTIQVLGAEKALFRALRTGGKPPKHGVIFQYPAIFRAPRWQRGKIARALAAKLAIAARIDVFSGEYKADVLKDEIEKRIREIKELYPRPPPRKTEPVRRTGKKKKRRRRKR